MEDGDVLESGERQEGAASSSSDLQDKNDDSDAASKEADKGGSKAASTDADDAKAARLKQLEEEYGIGASYIYRELARLPAFAPP